MYVESRKMKNMILFSKKKKRHRHREKCMDIKGEGGGMSWEIEIDVDTGLCIKQITKENLLCSTGSSTRCFVAT